MKKIKLTRIVPLWVVARPVNKREGIYKTLAFVIDYDDACLFVEVISSQFEWDVVVIERRTEKVDSIYHGKNFLSDDKPFREFVGGKNNE